MHGSYSWELHLICLYLQGYNVPKKFIATQGPKTETITDFWRMVKQEQCSVIACLCNLHEANRVKCDRYWPETTNKPEEHGPYIVRLLSEELFSSFTVRSIEVLVCGKKQNIPVIMWHTVEPPNKVHIETHYKFKWFICCRGCPSFGGSKRMKRIGKLTILGLWEVCPLLRDLLYSMCPLCRRFYCICTANLIMELYNIKWYIYSALTHVVNNIFPQSSDGSQESQLVKQFHFTGWPDHGVPEHGSPFVLFHEKMLHYYRRSAVPFTPIIVHCR